MHNLTIIAAVGKNNELGNQNELLWKIPEDMQFFRKKTIGKHIVMGMNTLNSLPSLLPDRKHIVLTQKNRELNSEIKVFNNKNDLLNYVKLLNDEVFIIGGAQIYALLLEDVDKMILTEIDASSKADVYFPQFDKSLWNVEEVSEHEYQGMQYKRLLYTRKKY